LDKPAILGGQPVTKKKIPFTKISISEDERMVVEEILRSKVFVNGPYTKLLEKEFANYIGAKYAIAVSNGTDALMLSYLALGINMHDKVVTTPLTFISTASTILHVGAIPLFADVKEDGNLDPNAVSNIKESFSAITIVHLFGYPADMNEFISIAKERDCFIIEDAAHAHGAEYRGIKVGNLGDIATFSFYPSKIIAAGGWGGIITTNNREFAEKIRLLRAHGELKIIDGKSRYQYIMLGYNFRISEIEAAIAYHQLKKLDKFVKLRRIAAKILTEMLSGLPGISLPTEEEHKKHAFYIYCIKIQPHVIGWTRDSFVEALNAEGIEARKGYHIPLHKAKLFININSPTVNYFSKIIKYPDYSQLKLKMAEKLTNTMVWLPIFPEISQTEIEAIAKAIKKLVAWKNRKL